MRLLSKELVSLDYRDQLQKDLARAAVCRFLVAYVSGEGINSIGRHLLTRVLRDPRSFGVSSLSCSCGYEALPRLQSELPAAAGVHLKYFMDPLPTEPAGSGEPGSLALFHSKLVYLALERERKSVVYIGSHNWTQRALGPRRPRNAEASLRVEMDLVPEDLDGTGSSLASEVNRHLLQAWNLPACLPAIASNEEIFKQWYEKGCRRSPQSALQEVVVVLSVLKGAGSPVSPSQWQTLIGRGIYLQVLEEMEGLHLWRSKESVLVLVWSSRSDLAAGNQPIILRCRITTNKAGPTSQLQGTNQSAAPIAGFEAVVFDEAQLTALQTRAASTRTLCSIWSGRNVELFDFEFPTHRPDSAQVDGGVVPNYQFHLEVEHVAFPAEGPRPETPDMIWDRASFAVAHSKESARYEERPGYEVPLELETKIRECLTQKLLIDLESARVLPVSQYDRRKVGKRLSVHPLHDTFLGKGSRDRRDELYAIAEEGSLIADLDDSVDSTDSALRASLREEPVSRVQRVFVTPLDKLQELWRGKASRLATDRREG